MNRRPLVSAATLTVLWSISGPVGAQDPTVPDLGATLHVAEPAPPQPGDAAMTCDQIKHEMQAIFRSKNVRPTPQGTQAACDLQRSMTITPAEQAAMMNPGAQAELAGQQKAAQIQASAQKAMAANGGVMQAINDPRLIRLATLADEKHCVFEDQAAPAQAPAADPCGSGVVTPAMVTGGVVPPAPAYSAASARTDPFNSTASPPVANPAVTPTTSAVPAKSGDPFVKQGNAAPSQKQPTADPFKKTN